MWSLLCLAATHNQLVTYDTVAKLTGMMTAGIGDILAPIQQYCEERQLPPLTVLVVNKQTGLPGVGFIATEQIPEAFQRVFGHDWLAEKAPTAEDFAAACSRAPDRR